MHALVSIFICCILPLGIVVAYFINQMYVNKKRAEVLIKAIENGSADADKIAEALQKPRKSERQRFNRRLLCGCIFSLIGIVLLIVGLVNLSSGSPISSDPVTVPLMLGGIMIAVGLSFLIVCRVTRNQLN